MEKTPKSGNLQHNNLMKSLEKKMDLLIDYSGKNRRVVSLE